MAPIDWTEESPAEGAARAVAWLVLALFGASLAWACFARLDVVAAAEGRLIPRSNLQIVQPAETGIVRELLVREGESVRAGQVLARMDAKLSEADRRQLANELRLRRLQLRRIDAELRGTPLTREATDAPELFSQVQAQYLARRQAHLDTIATERAVLAKAEQDLKSALEVESKLRRTLPIYRQQEKAIDDLTRDGFAGRLMLLDRQRERIQQEQDLAAQQFTIASLRATLAQSNQKVAQIQSAYRQALQNERVETEASANRLQEDSEKLAHREELLELRSPHDGVVKDLATRTPGSVIAAGTVLMTVVPDNEPLQAEVWITHLDAGLVEPGQAAKIKLAAYPFQRYGLVRGAVAHVSPDAADLPAGGEKARDVAMARTGYRALVDLDSMALEHDGRRYRLTPGMQVTAEVHLGTRTVIEYLLAPLQKVAREAAREP
jgi:HlyD family secretion protein